LDKDPEIEECKKEIARKLRDAAAGHLKKAKKTKVVNNFERFFKENFIFHRNHLQKNN